MMKNVIKKTYYSWFWNDNNSAHKTIQIITTIVEYAQIIETLDKSTRRIH